MKILINRIYKTQDQDRAYNKAFEKGWSFSTQNTAGKDGRVLFI